MKSEQEKISTNKIYNKSLWSKSEKVDLINRVLQVKKRFQESLNAKKLNLQILQALANDKDSLKTLFAHISANMQDNVEKYKKDIANFIRPYKTKKEMYVRQAVFHTNKIFPDLGLKYPLRKSNIMDLKLIATHEINLKDIIRNYVQKECMQEEDPEKIILGIHSFICSQGNNNSFSKNEMDIFQQEQQVQQEQHSQEDAENLEEIYPTKEMKLEKNNFSNSNNSVHLSDLNFLNFSSVNTNNKSIDDYFNSFLDNLSPHENKVSRDSTYLISQDTITKTSSIKKDSLAKNENKNITFHQGFFDKKVGRELQKELNNIPIEISKGTP